MLGKVDRIQLGISGIRSGAVKTLSRANEAALPIASRTELSAQLSLHEAAAKDSPGRLPRYRATLPRISDQAIRLAARLSAIMSPENRVALFMPLEPMSATPNLVSQVSLAMDRANGGSVLLINSDRAPDGPEMMDIERTAGVAEVLDGTATLASTIRTIADTGLCYIGCGQRSDSSSPPLKSALVVLLQLLRTDFSHIIINGPSFLHPDAPLLATVADGVVVCLKSGQHQRQELLAAKAELDAIKARLLGVVIVE